MPLSSRGQPCSVGSPPTIVALHVRSITALGRIILRFFFFSVFVLFSLFHPVWAHIHRHYGQGKTCGLSSNFFCGIGQKGLRSSILLIHGRQQKGLHIITGYFSGYIEGGR
ncbi:hypothetical protein QBC37DRAFT_177593 [Rhypophila decipiens]|uniref:Uncharacterized protein n=1 Tax=Rhypophila decipiens TaxID=261697 RepID=A0AAN6YHK6_9PEZI|nr:hypothetical protein QBC37DRAFT_177593 [Rhypophila decipiens]